MMNRNAMQKVIATIVIFGVAASGAITFLSVAATSQPAATVETEVPVQTPQQPVTPDVTQEGAVTPSPESGATPTVETPTE